MALTYAINGSTASLAPTSVQWVPISLGVDHYGAPVFAANYTVTMTFPTASPTLGQQWLTQASGGTSVNLTLPNRWLMESVILSSVHLELTRSPTLQYTHFSPFTITVRGATASALEVSPGA